MITVKDRRLLIPDNELTIGYFGDNKTGLRQFEFTDSTKFDYSFKLDINNGVDEPFPVDLDKTIDTDKIVLTWNILRGHLTTKDNIVVKNIDIKLRAFSATDEIWNSKITTVYIGKGFDATGTTPPITPSEFAIMEQTISGYKNDALNARDTTITRADEVAINTQTVETNKNTVVQLANEVATNTATVENDTETVLGYKNEVATNKGIVDEKTNTVTTKALEVANNTDTVNQKALEVSNNTSQVADNTLQVAINTQTVNNKTAIVLQKADEVETNTQEVANNKLAIEGYKISIEADKKVVEDDTAIVVTKATEVSNNTATILQKAIEVSDNTIAVENDRSEVATNTQTAIDKAAEALQSAANALISEQNSKTSENNAKGSETNALQAMQTATQAMSDLLNMMGTDIATLTDGKLTPSQIPALSINDVFSVASTDEMLLLTAQRGDVALIVADSVVSDSYILAADDPTTLANWKKLGVSYVANAGHATTADNATDSNMINGHRLVTMTESQYASAVLDNGVLYAVYPEV